MANYISSNNNRFYAAVESTFGNVPPISANNRLPAVSLHAHQQLNHSLRHDKTGTRTYLGSSPLGRRATAFAITTYLTSWNGTDAPGYDPLLQSACGAQPSLCGQVGVEHMADPLHLTTATAHGLSAGSGISQGSEVRFVATVLDVFTVLLNAPFSSTLSPGSLLTPSLTYRLGNSLPSVSLFDYWGPTTAVDRIVSGATVDTLDISLQRKLSRNGVLGLAADLIDSETFQPSTGSLQSFTVEPDSSNFDYSIVAGNLGQAWLGFSAQQIYTLTAASVRIKNNLVPRNIEFGSVYPRFIAAGPREVSLTFSLYIDDGAATKEIYLAAKDRVPIAVLLQLGQQQGQMMGIYLPAVVLELPLFDDRETKLIWDFKASLAQGTTNDEISIALA